MTQPAGRRRPTPRSSATAVEHLVTQVTRADEKLVFPGELGWHGAHVDGVLARALTGEDVAPPVLVRP